MPELETSAGPSGLDPYLTAPDLAQLLQVSVKHVYRLAANDSTMPVLRLGAVVRFPRAAMLRWLESKQQGFGRPRRSPKQVLSVVQVSDASGIQDRRNSSCAAPCAAAGPK